jgi:glycosyltransferase involved in cell wall biosynthesis
MQRACLIVPAFNEERTVARVLEVAHESGLFKRLICIDDGSRDGTAENAAAVPDVIVITQPNAGKARAMERGLRECDCEIVCFLDADLINLSTAHISALVEPVVNGNERATIGIFAGGRGATDLAQRIAPMISGQRCLERELLDDFDGWHVRFGIEHALNDHLKKKGVVMKRIPFPGASHVMKEGKRGVFAGFAQRLRMYYDIVRYNVAKRA